MTAMSTQAAALPARSSPSMDSHRRAPVASKKGSLLPNDTGASWATGTGTGNRLQRPHSHIDLRSRYEYSTATPIVTLTEFDINSTSLCTLSTSNSTNTLPSSWSGSSLADSTSTATNRANSVSTNSSPSQPDPGTPAWRRTWSRGSSHTTTSQTRDADTTSAAVTSTSNATARRINTASDTSTTNPNDNPRALTSHPDARQPQPPEQPVAHSARRPAPGLTARFKALGFGSSSSKKPSAPDTNPTPPTSDPVGRLNEHQLRQLDEKHLASSFSSVIARRGRPWRGAGASALRSSASQPNLGGTRVAQESPRLPEIRTTDPLVMDTQKYRLPDHTNGNGTKVTLDTRREHLQRQTSSQSQSDQPPPPPPKDTPPVATPAATTPPPTAQDSDYVPGLSSYFTPGRNRPGSIYTLSRASFANQLAQLTSLQLPDAESLSSKVSAIPTAAAATKALVNAADQIRSWISKAQEVIGGLDSDDDVEWAAAGGREGLVEVEGAISRFEELINVFVGAIEELQRRPDANRVPKGDLDTAVTQMESIVGEWAKIKATLQTVRVQVEMAMDWEELWNNVLGDIQTEMDELSRLVFEMEERRHKSIMAAGGNDTEFTELDTIAEDSPASTTRLRASAARVNLLAVPTSPSSPSAANATLSQDDSSLLALFARMQPLRASLDFLPMRLSTFETRADKSFPTACEELEMRRSALDKSYKKLEKDAESLRKELGEDRWVIVFRGAGRQAQKMHESVERSMLKLREAVDASQYLTNPPAMSKKIEAYEAKKMHYGPAIERVLSIIDRGVKDRLTVNGEVLRLHSDLQSRWSSLKANMSETDAIVEEVLADNKSRQLRDSVSSLLSNDRSTVGSGHETPGSSPPSSVIMTSLGFDPHTPVPSKGRSPGAPQSSNRRHSSLPAPTSAYSKRQTSRLSTIPSSSAATPLPSASQVPRPASTLDHRPRWNTSTRTESGVHHPYKPQNLTSPSPHPTKTPNTQRSAHAESPGSGSRLPTIRNIFHRSTSETPQAERSPSRNTNSRLGFRERLASPGPYSQQTLSKSSMPRLLQKNSMSALSGHRRTSLQPPGSMAEEDRYSRPASSLASTSSRRE
ncbi:hypothetical protein K4F52_007320, partial [Lecanicillium sp. MT-2017a]